MTLATCRRIAAALVLLGLPVATAGAQQTEKAADAFDAKGATAEERLLQAELLEVATGDLERAAELYRALIDDASIDRAVRDEARLGLGRVERKRGQLVAAREALGALVGDEEASDEVRRRARSYLVELERGEPADRRFDWIAELQSNPEIQARLFADIMALTDPEKAVSAARQLLALGPVAVPMLEQAADQSRDPEQRRRIAILLVQLGNFDRLSTAFAPGVPENPSNTLYVNLVEAVRGFRDEESTRLRDALRDLALEDERAVERASALSIAAGETRDPAEHLARVERAVSQPNLPSTEGLKNAVFTSLLATPEGREAVRARILTLDPERVSFYLGVFGGLPERALDVLEPRHIVELLRGIDQRDGNPPDLRIVRVVTRLIDRLVEKRELEEAL